MCVCVCMFVCVRVCARGEMVTVFGNGHGDPSSNLGRGYLHFT